MGWLPPIIPLLAVILLLGTVKSKTLLLPLVLKLQFIYIYKPSSVEAKYGVAAHTTSEMLWVRSLFQDIGGGVATSMEMYHDIRPLSSLLTI